MFVMQAQVVSPSVQAITNRSRRQEFYDRYSCPPWGFKVHPLNLDRGDSGDDCGHPLNLDWSMGHSGDGCGHIHWDLLWHRDCLLRFWGRVMSWYD